MKLDPQWPILYREETDYKPTSIDKWLTQLDDQGYTIEDLSKLTYLPLQTVLHAVCCRYFDVGDVEKAKALLEKHNKENPDPILHNVYLRCMLASPTTTKIKFNEESLKWSKLYADETNALTNKDFSHLELNADKVLSIGVLCGYAYTSLFDVLFTPLFREINRKQFRLVLFNIGAFSTDKLQECFDYCVDMPIHTTESLSSAILDNKIDILIDLNGRFRLDNPIDVLLKRVAPVQISYGNMLATYALKTINYIMTDSYTLPKSDEKFYTEKIYRFESNVMGTFELPDTPITALPCLNKQVAKPFKFASFNATFKLNDLVLDTWGKILQRVPNSILLIKAGGITSERITKRLLKMVKKYNLDGRVMIEGFSPMNNMLEQYDTVDLALNTFPYSGGTTTAYALWKGVPSITIEDDLLIQSGGGYTILREVALDAFVAKDVEQYIAKAVYFATNLEKLGEIRKTMRKRLSKSARFNPDLFAADFEKGLRFVWKDWLENAEF